jgi:hypothetical protein
MGNGTQTDVKLPNGISSPFDYIVAMRDALESPEITKDLHIWIDNYFG